MDRFLDSDDYWKKDKLLYIFEKIKKNTFDVICHNEWIIDTSENNKKIEKKLWSYGPYEKDFYKKINLGQPQQYLSLCC